MPNILQGKYTIKEVLNYTWQSEFKTRFEYKQRDVLKGFRVVSVKKFDKDRTKAPLILYRIISYSYPQYYPYKQLKGKKSIRQRKIKHQYDVILELQELSINVPFKWRTGSEKLPIKKAPQSMIKQVYPENKKLWNKKRIEIHKREAPYLNTGDYNARYLGVNLDFFYRLSWILKQMNMLYGKSYANSPPKETNPKFIPFFDKHCLNLILILMNKGIFKNN